MGGMFDTIWYTLLVGYLKILFFVRERPAWRVGTGGRHGEKRRTARDDVATRAAGEVATLGDALVITENCLPGCESPASLLHETCSGSSCKMYIWFSGRMR
jgi:hypothetical protein